MIAAAMLAGPGESLRWLDRTLRHVCDWADRLIVHCDGADRDTISAVQHAAKVMRVSRSGAHVTTADGVFLKNESEARNRLLELCDEVLKPGSLIVVLDCDEQLWQQGHNSVRSALQHCAADHHHDAWPCQFHHAWAPDLSAVRIDAGWAPSWGARAYRHRPGGRIDPKPMACTPVPAWIAATSQCPASQSPLRILHLGYARADDRPAKHARYATLTGHSGAHVTSILTPPTLEPVPCPS